LAIGGWPSRDKIINSAISIVNQQSESSIVNLNRQSAISIVNQQSQSTIRNRQNQQSTISIQQFQLCSSSTP
jgi:hypothetical protein